MAAEKYFPIYQRLLEEENKDGGGFFVGRAPTYIDFFVADYFHTLKAFEPTIIAKYPSLGKHTEKILSLPKLKKYIANRPVTIV